MSDIRLYNLADAPRDRRRSRRFSSGLMSRYRHVVRYALVVGAALLDMLCFLAAGWLASAIRYGVFDIENISDAAALLAPIYFLAAFLLHAYDIRTLRVLGRTLLAAFLALCIAVAVGFFVVFALKVSQDLSRVETANTLVIVLSLLWASRLIGYRLLRRMLAPAIEPRIVVLTDGVGIERRSGNRSTTLVDVRNSGLVPELSDPAFFDRIGRLARDVDRIVLSFADPRDRMLWSRAMRLSGFDAEVVADTGDMLPLALSSWENHPTLVISRGPLNLGERFVKRLFDLMVTSAMLVVFGPIIGVFAILVKLDSPGPAFFVQERVGRNNRSYRCFKLRSMRTDRTDDTGGVSASRNDDRVTRLGKFLRRSSIDELPQLFNVLIGDMSLVGPRPHALGSRAEGALFWELVPDYWSRHAMKPGVTGLAQVRGFRGATHHRADIEQRVAADLEYINGWSLWLDIKILLMTVRVTVHHNAY